MNLRNFFNVFTRSAVASPIATPPAPAADLQLQERGLYDRQMTIRAASVDEESRSVEAVIATEGVVQIYDWQRDAIIDEVLVAEGGEFPERMAVLNNHGRWSLDDVLGSARGFRRDNTQWIGRMHLAGGDDSADRAWNKIKQGHLTDVSVGYRVDMESAIYLRPGESREIHGKRYEAKQRTLRVAVKWQAREVSLVPIGADPAAKIRESSERVAPSNPHRKVHAMNDHLRHFLEMCGLRAEASDEQAWAFYRDKLNEQQRGVAETLVQDSERTEAGLEEQQGAGAVTPSTRSAQQPTPAGGADPQSIARDAVRAERQRETAIRGLAGTDIPDELVQRAINEEWDVSRASQQFLQHVRDNRPAPASTSGPFANTGRGVSADDRRNALAASLVLRAGFDTEAIRVRGVHDPDQRTAARNRLAEIGDDFRSMSLPDLCRMVLTIDGRDVPYGTDELSRAAFSTPSLASVFTDSVNAMVDAAFAAAPDTTGWCEVGEVNNFQTQTDITLGRGTGMALLPRSQSAPHMTFQDNGETFRAYRFAEQFVVDEQDVIDDRLDALLEAPRLMAEEASLVRPRIVYALLLANAALADTGALFNATAVTTAGGHANLTTAVLGTAGLSAAITAIGKQVHDGVNLNLRGRYLVVPQDLRLTAAALLYSTQVVTAGTSDPVTVTPNLNAIQRENIQLISDNYIGAAGVTDPITGTAYTGLATNWFLFSDRRTVKVVYRRGTNRSPMVRSFALDKGQWGMGWDINLDIGAYARDFRGSHKSTGAG